MSVLSGEDQNEVDQIRDLKADQDGKIVNNECDSWWPKKAAPIKLITVYSLLFKLMYNVDSI